MYGSTFAFISLGLYTDFLARGRYLNTLLLVLILFQVTYVIFFTVYEEVTNGRDSTLY